MTDQTHLLRAAESYLSALHGSVARHDNLAADLGCAGCELRNELRAALRHMADETPEPGFVCKCPGWCGHKTTAAAPAVAQPDEGARP